MLEHFNDIEALEVGLNLEKEGLAFYTQAAAAANNQKTAALFRQLAVDEEKHYQRFAQERQRLLPADYQDNGEIADYLRRLVRQGIFPPWGESLQRLAETKSGADVIRLAIQAEKDSLLFYHEAASQSQNESGRQLFEWLITEERRHLRNLSEMLAE